METTSERAAALALQCDRATQTATGWQACCPAHDDSTPSLSITPADGKVLMFCHAGCDTSAVLAALGLGAGDLFCESEARPPAAFVCAYQYCDALGRVVHETVRYHPKKFSQRQPDPAQPGHFIWNLRGIEPVLYHLPAVVIAAAAGGTVYLCEGEKDTDALIAACGVVATCNAMGAGKWRASYTEALRGASVIILPHNDVPGRDHAGMVRNALQRAHIPVAIVELPGRPVNGGDVADWLASGGTADQLADLAAMVDTPGVPMAPAATLEPQSGDHVSHAGGVGLAPPALRAMLLVASQVQEEAMSYLWEPYIPRQMVTILDGDPGVGKTGFACMLAAAVSKGFPLPNQYGIPTPTGADAGTVLMVAMEDHLGAVVLPRLNRLGADLDRITFLNECRGEDGTPRPFTLADLPLLALYMEENHPQIVYIDAIQAVLGDKLDINRANQVTAILGPLKKLAEDHNCAVLCSRHPAKPGQQVAKVLYRGMGSQAFIGTVRSGLFIEEHPDDDTKFLVVHYKSNIGKLGLTHICAKAHGRFEWCGVTRITAAMLAGGGSPGPSPTQRIQACLWLEKYLAGAVGAVAASEVYRAAEDTTEYSHKVVQSASQYLRIIKTQVPGDFLWTLPQITPPLVQDTNTTYNNNNNNNVYISGVIGSTNNTGGTGVLGVDSELVDVSELGGSLPLIPQRSQSTPLYADGGVEFSHKTTEAAPTVKVDSEGSGLSLGVGNFCDTSTGAHVDGGASPVPSPTSPVPRPSGPCPRGGTHNYLPHGDGRCTRCNMPWTGERAVPVRPVDVRHSSDACPSCGCTEWIHGSTARRCAYCGRVPGAT